MALAALALAWLFEIDLWAYVSLDFAVLWQSGLAVLPLLLLFGVTYRWPWGPLGRIQELLRETLGPSLLACRWYDLPLLAGLAGLGEELLFRGVLQIGVSQWTTPLTGLIVASMLFGFAHAITPLYAVLAGLIGLYLGSLLYTTETPNLLLPVLVHAVYDLIAFVVLREDCRLRQRRIVSSESPG